MNRWQAFLLGSVLSVITPVNSAGAAKPEPLRVVTSTSDLASLAVEIGGDRVEVTYLANGHQDPHFVPASARSLGKLTRADLLMVIGLQLESLWLGEEALLQPSLLAQCRNSRIQFGSLGYFDLSRYVQILDVPNEITRGQGSHPLGNPHYWLDPENGRRVARAITAKLGAVSPKDTPYFEQRLTTFEARLDNKERFWQEKLRRYRGYKVITYHRAWTNFLMHFGLDSAGEIEPFPGIPPDRNHTNALIQEMVAQNVRLILVEPFYRTNAAETIARKTGAKVLVLPDSVLGAKPVADYFDLFDFVVDSLTQALQ